MKLKPYFAGALFVVLFTGLIFTGQSFGLWSSEERGEGHGGPPASGSPSQYRYRNGIEEPAGDEDFEFEKPSDEGNVNNNEDKNDVQDQEDKSNNGENPDSNQNNR